MSSVPLFWENLNLAISFWVSPTSVLPAAVDELLPPAVTAETRTSPNEPPERVKRLPFKGNAPPTVVLAETSATDATPKYTVPVVANELKLAATVTVTEEPAPTTIGLVPKPIVTRLSEVMLETTGPCRIPDASQTETPE